MSKKTTAKTRNISQNKNKSPKSWSRFTLKEIYLDKKRMLNFFPLDPDPHSECGRVGHRVLLRSERIVLLRSFKARNVLLRSFFELLATYETQKNDAFFCVLFLSCWRLMKPKRTMRSFAFFS